MAEPYLKELRSLVERFAPRRDGDLDIECKHFFSGAAAYENGHIFMSLTPVGLALKLPERDRDALMSEGGAALKYFPKAPVKKEYVVLPGKLVEDERALGAWIMKSIEFGRT
ncbi:MAG: TfoX/Sxy family protein [Proteobacteria bacterium]|nr:TfoX/Sxy family protein [Pseudomonadota bacterium]MCH8188092.1 TfoX/Sxy family protein [Pseudomonadota bacterium]